VSLSRRDECDSERVCARRMELGGSWAPRGPAEEEEEGEDLDRNVASERGWILARIGQELLPTGGQRKRLEEEDGEEEEGGRLA